MTAIAPPSSSSASPGAAFAASGSAIDAVTLHALAAFPAQLAAHFALFPVEARHWAPSSWDGVPSEPLTAIEQVCHGRDIEIEGYGPLTFKSLIHYLCSHDQQHLAGLQWVLGQYDAAQLAAR